MGQEHTTKPASTWLGTTIFSILTGAAFSSSVFLILFSNTWFGLFFIFIAIAFARLCWVTLPKDHKLQLCVTGLTIFLAMAFLLYLISQLTPHIM